jgi:ubiquinone/menaquinone biosynthesis C-methylase UbiE
MGDRSAWDRYWQADRIASCMDGAGQSNYDDRIAAGWRAFFRTLPAGSRILDLCTGNGAVAVIAAEVGSIHGKSFAITGIDLADIDPKRFVSRYGIIANGISFVAKANCEALSYADSSFDAVVSQYGVEYSDLDKTLAQAVRVLVPGGRLRLFMHAKEGTVVASTKKAIADADFLLDKARLCDKAAVCFRAVHAFESQISDAAAAAKSDRSFEDFRAALKKTADYQDRATDQAMVRNTAGVLLHAFENRMYFSLDALVAKAAELKAEISAHRSRQKALVYSAVTAARMAKLAAALVALGMVEVGWGEERPGAEFVGYIIEGEKRQA